MNSRSCISLSESVSHLCGQKVFQPVKQWYGVKNIYCHQETYSQTRTVMQCDKYLISVSFRWYASTEQGDLISYLELELSNFSTEWYQDYLSFT